MCFQVYKRLVFIKKCRFFILIFNIIVICFLLVQSIKAEGTYTIIQDEDGIFFQTDQDGSWAISSEDLKFFSKGEVGTYDICSDKTGTYITTGDNKFYINETGSNDLIDENEAFYSERYTNRENNQTTKVKILGNSILVPVKLAYKNREVTAQLLLDTGASITTLNQDVADRLRLKPKKSSSFRLADGRVIEAGVGTLSYIKVGPLTKRNFYGAVVEYLGPKVPYQGLLGMNFLKGLDYRIDYERELILWKP